MRANECDENHYKSIPKRTGLWVRVTLTDESTVDGVIDNDLLKFPFVIPMMLILKNGLRLPIPRETIKLVEVLATIRPPSRGKK